MTALKPLENVQGVRGVKASRYPLNRTCSMPECTRTDVTAHHIFPRSAIGNSLWFVEIGGGECNGPRDCVGTDQGCKHCSVPLITPHVVGLCGHGTEGHHGDVEEHRAWIKLEDGEFFWYDRLVSSDSIDLNEGWANRGPLNPQPGSREGKPKRRKHKGEARRKRATISIRVPQDEQENGGAVWDELMENVREKLARELREPGKASGPDERPAYYVLCDALNDWLFGLYSS